MKFTFNQQKFNPVNGYNHVFCSANLDYKGGLNAIVHKPMFNYDTLKPYCSKIHYRQGRHPFFVSRYITYERFKQSVDDDAYILSFLSPYKWHDPYETLFYEPNMLINGNKYHIACLCCTYDEVDSEESAWTRSKLTQHTDKKIIRVSYNMEMLYNAMEQFATHNKEYEDLRFYFSIVDYSQSKVHLIPSNKPKSYTSIDEYLNIMSLKRKAFAYENELRIFVVSKGIKCIYSTHGVLDIRVPKSIMKIVKITMPPRDPISLKSPLSKIYNELQDSDNYDLRRELMSLVPGVTINQSRLYQIGKSSSSWVTPFVTMNNIW